MARLGYNYRKVFVRAGATRARTLLTGLQVAPARVCARAEKLDPRRDGELAALERSKKFRSRARRARSHDFEELPGALPRASALEQKNFGPAGTVS